MKRITTLAQASFFCIISVTAQVNNGGFESWTGQVPNGWSTNNIAPASLFPITASDDAHSGLQACRGEVIASSVAYPPVLQSLAQAITTMPGSFTGWYKFGPASESEQLTISLTIVDAGGGLVGVGFLSITEPESSYTEFNFPITAYNTNPPASVTISVGIAGTGGTLTPGSWFLLDDLDCGVGTGVQENANPAVLLGQPFPQPAQEAVRIPLEMVQAERISARVFDAQGRMVHALFTGVSPSGSSFLEWTIGAEVANGLYHVEVAVGAQRSTRLVMVQR
ncbi:MAG TPA: hypothetical protein PL070_05240 [Flavobacteriales bacterium]|nr:hypothetical protein [Flavobacteriales bacterium]